MTGIIAHAPAPEVVEEHVAQGAVRPHVTVNQVAMETVAIAQSSHERHEVGSRWPP